MSKTRKRIPHIVLNMIDSNKASRDKLRGILKYVRLHGHWLVHPVIGKTAEQQLNEIRHWEGSGIISETYAITDAFEKAIVEAHLPTVLLDPVDSHCVPPHPFSTLCSIRCDGHAVGRLAAEHLMELKCRHFAFVGYIHDVNWSRNRYEGFATRLAESDFQSFDYGNLSEEEQFDWGIERKRLCAWLQRLPKPVGILVANDSRGRQVIEACQIAEIDIPEEVAILGVDNDELICETTDPPLSSIVTDNEGCGYRAAEMLDALMRRNYRKQRNDHYGPLYVVQRRSTETMMISDRIVIQALEFIRLNSSSPIGVNDVSKHLDLSRRLLELRFKESLGRTVRDEIMRVRMDRVRNFLIGTDLHISEIAVLCGFPNEYYLCTIFKRVFGVTMSQFRNDHRFKIETNLISEANIMNR